MIRPSSRFSALSLSLLLATACSSGPKRTTPRLADLEGKRIALVEIQAEPTQRSMIEVGLINQLQKEGTFELISKEEIAQARSAPDLDPMDKAALGRRVRADYLLEIQGLTFDAIERSGRDRITVEDSQLAEERGEAERLTTRLVKVKSLTGKVVLKLRFTELPKPEAPSKASEPREALATREEVVTASEEKSAIHLPPKVRFLERLTQEALSDFFKKYRD